MRLLILQNTLLLNMRRINLEKERELENQKVLNPDTRQAQDGFYRAVAGEIEAHYSRTMDVIKDKSILEIGCSEGKMAIIYSRIVKDYEGCDISDLAISKANGLQLLNSSFTCCDAHHLPYSDGSFDVVIVSSLLHHLDLRVALLEIHRVLNDDGKLIFREPLGINPIFTLYRWLTPNVRTPDERPFTFSDIGLVKSQFNVTVSVYFGFVALICSVIKFPKTLHNVLLSVDRVLSKTLVKYLFWQWSGIGIKKPNNA